jgi:hypothetical protein
MLIGVGDSATPMSVLNGRFLGYERIDHVFPTMAPPTLG